MTACFRRVAGLLRLSGRDRIRWLQGFVTAELTTIGPGAGCLAVACNRQGKMIGVMVVRIFEDHLLLETEPELVAPLLSHFDRFIIREDVGVEDVSSQWRVVDRAGQPNPTAFLASRFFANAGKVLVFLLLALGNALVFQPDEMKKAWVRAWRACGYLYQIPRSLFGKI